MCLLNLLSLLGCGNGTGKGGFVADGPGMERELWSAFTLSQSSDVYEQNYSYTVVYDEASGDVQLYTEVPHETMGYPVEVSVRLEADTASKLFNLNLLSFPDAIPYEGGESVLDGTFCRFTVTDRNGHESEKLLSSDAEQTILELLAPYIRQLEGGAV